MRSLTCYFGPRVCSSWVSAQTSDRAPRSSDLSLNPSRWPSVQSSDVCSSPEQESHYPTPCLARRPSLTLPLPRTAQPATRSRPRAWMLAGLWATGSRLSKKYRKPGPHASPSRSEPGSRCLAPIDSPSLAWKSPLCCAPPPGTRSHPVFLERLRGAASPSGSSGSQAGDTPSPSPRSPLL